MRFREVLALPCMWKEKLSDEQEKRSGNAVLDVESNFSYPPLYIHIPD